MKLLDKIRSKGWKVLLLDVLLVIASFVLAGKLLTLAEDAEYDLRLSWDESSLYSRLENREYPYFLDYATQNLYEKRIGYDSDDMMECYAVADYYEAASLYRAYLATGDGERAAAMKARMEEAEATMGELSIEIPKICSQLGIEE